MSIKSIGNYTLGKTIGEGTFGQVKLGYHTLTNEVVAIKILEKVKVKDITDQERISREINILKKLRHQNIIQIYEIVETESSLYLIMEYASGGELFDLIIRNQRLSERDAAEFLLQILSGVQYMHNNNVMHRDLKPENLLLDQNRQIKIVDFGLSNTFGEGQLLKTACGSPCYAAPEMIAGKEYDPKSADTWSCGVILFAMVNGYLPFEDQNTAQLYKKIIYGEYATPKYMSPLCKDLLDKILQVDPLKRINIEQICRHYWIQTCITSPILTPGYGEVEICPDVLAQMTKFNFKQDVAQAYLKANKHNAMTVTYYLLLTKYYREKQEDKEEILQYKAVQAPVPQHPQVILKETSNIQSQRISQIEYKDLKSSINSQQKSVNSVNIFNNEMPRISNIPEMKNSQVEEEIIENIDEAFAQGSNPQNGSNIIKTVNEQNLVNAETMPSQNLEQSIGVPQNQGNERKSLPSQTPPTPNNEKTNYNTNLTEYHFPRTRQVSVSVEKRPETLFPTVEQIKLKAQQFKQKAYEHTDRSPVPPKRVIKTPQRQTVYKAPQFNQQHSFERPHSPAIQIKQHDGPYHMEQLVFNDPHKVTSKVASQMLSQDYEIKKSKFEIKISKQDFQMQYQIFFLCENIYVIKCTLINGDAEEYQRIYKSIINLR